MHYTVYTIYTIRAIQEELKHIRKMSATQQAALTLKNWSKNPVNDKILLSEGKDANV